MKENVDFLKSDKPNGKVKLELFDKDGNVESKHISDNFISKGYEAILNNYMRTLFTGERNKSPKDFNSLGNLFQGIMLTDYNGQPDPENEWNVRGNLIGKGSSLSEEVGSSTVGTYNRNESITTGDHVRLVFDFGMDSALGTIKSVYTVPIENPFKATFNVGEQSNSGFVHNNKIYYILNRGSARGVIVERDFNGIKTNERKIEVSGVPDNYIHSIAYLNGYVYIGGDTRVGDRLRIARIKFENLFDESTPTENVMRASNTSHFLTSDGVNLYAGYGSNLYKVDFGNESVEEVNVKNFGSINNGYYIKDDVVFGTDRFVKIDSNDDNPVSFGFSYSGSVIGGGDGYILVKHESLSGFRGISLNPLYLIGSRTLLDAPVTKTESTTMRVTYDFLLPPMF